MALRTEPLSLPKTPLVLVVMGVSGSGKTTIGKALAERLQWPFQEGDDLHSAANVVKMRSGTPLDDADRIPWLERVAAWIDGQLAAGRPGIVTCSALKRRYRDLIIGKRRGVVLVFLHGDAQVIAHRMVARKGHFMRRSMLASQLAALEPPKAGEQAIAVDIARPIAECVEHIIAALPC